MHITAIDIVGMLGTALVVLAYLLQQLGKLAGDALSYLYMNLGGAILLLISLCVNFNLASFVIELLSKKNPGQVIISRYFTYDQGKPSS
jgi:hypothetical protein